MNALWLLTSVRRRDMVSLLNRLIKVDSTICRLSNLQLTTTFRLQAIIVFIVLIITWVVLIISDVYAYNTTIFDWFNDILPSFIITQFLLQYALIVKMIEIRYRSLNIAIVDLSKSSTTKTFRSFVLRDEITLMNCEYLPKVIDFRRAHKTLYDIGSDVAEFYSFPILFIIGLSCFEIVYNSYWSLMPLTVNIDVDPAFIVINSVAWILGLIVPIGILAKAVENITAEMRKTTDAIYTVLDGCNLSREDKAELEQFSVELLHRKIEFSAYGLFPLDCSLVHSIFSSTITYLVILLQFQISTVKPETSEKPELAADELVK
ncbi:putative gustatory receptor 28b isoform X2 [Venturia canescens]|uniref:putative gustatory receptor 28b isoform X2 n=1 Tax=Venturia canescens TaxID=32260 RepID=UPI001C9BC5A9|nr:putative gustatory receptor 28b isoform X2 [Venturia canescens]